MSKVINLFENQKFDKEKALKHIENLLEGLDPEGICLIATSGSQIQKYFIGHIDPMMITGLELAKTTLLDNILASEHPIDLE